MDLKSLLEKNIAYNGYILQKTVAVEEMSELTKELVKDLRGIADEKHIAEEIADVEIMLEQLKIIYNNSDIVEKFKVAKLERILKNLFKNEVVK